MSRTWIPSTLIACMLLIGAMAMAQNSADQRPASDRVDRTSAESHTSSDGLSDDQHLIRYLAGRLALMNHSAIQMSKMAKERAHSEDVQQFAGTIVQQHTQLNEQLHQFAPEVISATLQDATPGVQRTTGFRGESKEGRQADRKQRIPEPKLLETERDEKDLVSRLLRIDRNALQNYLSSSQEMLKRYEGQDFDMGFLGFQIGSHTWALAELDAMKGIDDQEFQQIVQESYDHLNKHLQKAQDVARTLEDDRRQQSSQQESMN